MVMSVPDQPQANVFESGSLDELRRGLNDPEPSDLRRVAEEFESVFMSMMLKNMRAATPGDELFGSKAMDKYQQLHDQQLAQNLGGEGGLGIADMVERQLRENAGLDPRPEGAAQERGIGDYDRSMGPLHVRIAEPEPAPDPRAGAPEPDATGGKGSGWDEPEAFVRDVWPAAREAAKELGAEPRALVAQAALETGWGQHVIRDGSGASSNNLFGIKAGAGWQGDTVRVPTLEFREGVPEREMASFRKYDSLEEGFRDYVRFLEDNPRYREALNQADDPQRWAEGLQEAGYATDPQYADKIQRIMEGDPMETAVDALKSGDSRPLTEL